MSDSNSVRGLDLKFLFRGIVVWSISALVLLLILSAVVSKCSISSSSIGYISSALSFATAFLAGTLALKGNNNGLLVKGFILSAALTILLLTVGFIIKGDCMKPSGILSVVSFTLSGCLLGCVMSSFFKGNSSGRKFKRKNPFHR